MDNHVPNSLNQEKECVMPKPTTTKGNTNMTDAIANTDASTEVTKLSLEQRLANARKLVAKYEAELNAERQINNVEVGDAVTFKFGRSDKARVLSGTIIAVADTDTGRLVAVQTGEGLDIETKKIRAADILSNTTAEARTAAEAPVEGEVVEGYDPLNEA